MYNKAAEWCGPILHPLGLISLMASASLLPVALVNTQGTVLIVAPPVINLQPQIHFFPCPLEMECF